MIWQVGYEASFFRCFSYAELLESQVRFFLQRGLGQLDTFHWHFGHHAIVSTASGCGVTVKDYGRLLADDSNYADRAAQVAAATVDVGEYLTGVSSALQPRFPGKRIAWHPPCSLQHGQQLEGIVETLLTGVGYELLPVTDAVQRYAERLLDQLTQVGVRATIDRSGDRLGKLIRTGEQMKIPVLAVIGAKEAEQNAVSLRSRRDGDLGVVTMADLLRAVQNANAQRAAGLELKG